MLHLVDRPVDRVPEALKLLGCGVQAELLDASLELEARYCTRLVDVEHYEELKETYVFGLEDGCNLLQLPVLDRGSCSLPLCDSLFQVAREV